MTREEAIKVLNTYDVNFDEYTAEEIADAIDMAIEALEQIESGRYLKGECSICSKEFGTLGCCTTVSNHWVYSCKEGMAQYAEALEQEPKRGKWILKNRESDGNYRYMCSECGHIDIQAKTQEVPYCWYCGSSMESEEE